MQTPAEDRYLMTRSELLYCMTVLLGVRVVQILIFREAAIRVADDLQRATEIARTMVTRHSMETDVGQVSEIDRPRSSCHNIRDASAFPKHWAGDQGRTRYECYLRDYGDSLASPTAMIGPLLILSWHSACRSRDTCRPRRTQSIFGDRG